MNARRLALLLAALLAGCSDVEPARLHFLDTRADERRPATFVGMPLRTGQVVLSEAVGAYSLLFSLGPARSYDFTHAGILVMEDGEPFVYEMTGEYKLGFGDRPTDGIEGTCRRVPLLEYSRGYLFVEIFDPPAGVDPAKVGAWAQAQLRDGTPFDAYFDWAEHEALFCTEFVQLALEAGGAPPLKELVPVRQQPSLQRLLKWAGVANERCLPAGLYADPERTAAALGLFPTRTAAECYFAAKAELHRRFTDDQKLGNLFEMTGLADVTIRGSVYLFLQDASRLLHGTQPGPDEIRAAVQAMADERFGVVQERAGAPEERR